MAGEAETGDSFALLERWREGDQLAAAELFERYAERLLALAHRRLAAGLAPRLDPEDVIQSVYGSFFAGARNGRFVLQRSGDLWRLLVAITLHKVRRQMEHHTADKRSVAREAADSAAGICFEPPAREPSPAEAAVLAETLETLFLDLRPVQRQMVELRLQGHTITEIAGVTGRSLATVERLLRQVKERLENEPKGD